jgi:hypothetical protein
MSPTSPWLFATNQCWPNFSYFLVIAIVRQSGLFLLPSIQSQTIATHTNASALGMISYCPLSPFLWNVKKCFVEQNSIATVFDSVADCQIAIAR